MELAMTTTIAPSNNLGTIARYPNGRRAGKPEYCDLVEDVRRGRAVQMCESEQRIRDLPFRYQTRNWVVPSYDVTGLFDRMPKERPPELSGTVIDFVCSDEFILPHEDFTVIINEWTNPVVVYISADMDRILARDDVNIRGTEGYVADIWEYIPSIDTWGRRGYGMCSRGYFPADFDGTDSQNAPQPAAFAVLLAARMVVNAFLMLLQNKFASSTLHLAALPESHKLAQMNRGRALAQDPLKRRPIPAPQRVVYVSTEPIIKVIHGGRGTAGSGSPKSGHERRSHFRTYKKTGRTIEVSATLVKGGYADIPTPAKVKMVDCT